MIASFKQQQHCIFHDVLIELEGLFPSGFLSIYYILEHCVKCFYICNDPQLFRLINGKSLYNLYQNK